jgi:hypothetical protein
MDSGARTPHVRRPEATLPKAAVETTPDRGSNCDVL